ncbi:MAG: hypothetical protein PHF11_05405, partial [Candidatus Omnitrophica bacterium]|nr:hypothetical protein [Candidatus Omnitrophota bacterium]
MTLAGESWQQLWVEFTPKASGLLSIRLSGSLYPDNATNCHAVYVDDVNINGTPAVSVKNGSFEYLNEYDSPTDWYKDVSTLSQAAVIAHTGRYSMLVWHDAALIQGIKVQADRKYRVSAYFKARNKQ